MSFPIEEKYMHRCLQLAALSAGYTAPNPMVGAVLVHKERIIGEGRHEFYGGPHAEVNCFNSVTETDQEFVSDSILYVSLEPCAHFGKTPPCADLIIEKGVKKVVIGIRDPFDQVNGRGIEKLKAAGVEVLSGVCENECRNLNRRFFKFHQQQQPYIVLKWAQSADGYIGNLSNERLHITNEQTNVLVHKWRSEEAAILVGTNTALNDDPQLNVRHWTAKQPAIIVIDRKLKLPDALKLFSSETAVHILNDVKDGREGNKFFFKTNTADLPAAVSELCRNKNILSVLIEGGAATLQSFIDADFWDEARVITNESLNVGKGVRAPVFKNNHLTNHRFSGADKIEIFKNQK